MRTIAASLVVLAAIAVPAIGSAQAADRAADEAAVRAVIKAFHRYAREERRRGPRRAADG